MKFKTYLSGNPQTLCFCFFLPFCAKDKKMKILQNKNINLLWLYDGKMIFEF